METVRRKGCDASNAAGEVARRRFEVPRAVELHEQALFLAANDDERSRALEGLGDDHATAFKADDSVRRYQQALELIRGDGSRRADVARVCAKVGNIAWRSGAFAEDWDPAEIERLLEEGLAASDDDETRCRLLAALCGARRFWRVLGGADPVPPETRIRSGEEAWILADRLGDAELKDLVLDVLQGAYWYEGRLDRVLDLAPRRLELLDQIPSRNRQADLLNEVAMILIEVKGDLAAGLDLARRSRDFSRGISAHELLHATSSMMQAAYQLGLWDELMETLEEHLIVFEGESAAKCQRLRNGPLFAALALAHRGERRTAEALADRMRVATDPDLVALAAMVHTALGGHQAVRKTVEDAWIAARNVQDRVVATPPLIEALAPNGEWDAMERVIDDTRGLAEYIPSLRAHTTRAEGKINAAVGDLTRAREAFRSAEAEFERLQMRFEVARTREVLAEVSDDEAARELLEAALTTYEDLRAAPHASRVRNVLLAGSNS
jgi:tetratricopeptide (TPR) repeat protein